MDDHSDHPTMFCHHEMEARDVTENSMAPPGWSWCGAVSAFDQAPVINRVEIFSREFVVFVRVGALASVVTVVGSTPATVLYPGRDVAGWRSRPVAAAMLGSPPKQAMLFKACG